MRRDGADITYREHPLAAGYAQRAGASLLDGIVFLACVPIPLELAIFIGGFDMPASRSRAWFWAGALVFTLVYSWVISRRRSFGQIATGIRVRTDDDRPPTLPMAFVRTVVKLAGFAGWAYVWSWINWGAPTWLVVMFAPFGVGLLWPLVDDRDRAWHDIVSRTRAVSV